MRFMFFAVVVGAFMWACSVGVGAGDQNAGPKCEANSDGKPWNLGTGRLADIRRTAPGFLTSSTGRWRRQGIHHPVNGAEIRPAMIDGSDAFEIITRDAPYRVRAIRIGDKIAILATPGRCPHVTAIDHCPDGRLETEIKITGTISCLGPLSVPDDHVMITMGNNEVVKEKLVFGEPFMVTSHSVSVFFSVLLAGSNEPAARIERKVNDFSDALPQEVAALVRYGQELPAGLLYRNVPDDLKTADATAQIIEARVAGVAEAASAVTTPRELNDLIKSHPKTVLPGDDETKVVIVARVRELVDREIAAEPTPDRLFTIGLFVTVSASITDEKPNVVPVEAKYGPLLGKPGFNEPKIQGAFMSLLPESRYTKTLEVEEANEAKEVESDARKQAVNAEVEDAWIEVQSRGDEVATLTYKIRFGQRNFAQSQHNVRGLTSMQKYREGLLRDSFCPAKRAFVKRAGTGEFNRRAAEHCKNEPPTDVGVGGGEKTLTAECRDAFASAC